MKEQLDFLKEVATVTVVGFTYMMLWYAIGSLMGLEVSYRKILGFIMAKEIIMAELRFKERE